MGYLDQLRARESGKPAIAPTDKTDKTPFVSFGSSPGSPISSNCPESALQKGAPRTTDKTDRTSMGHREEIRQHLIRLLPGEDHPDFAEAFALALDYPGALACLRLSHPPMGGER
jgi:hypothetical protein